MIKLFLFQCKTEILKKKERNRETHYKFAHFLLRNFSSKRFPLEEMHVEYIHMNEK